MKTAPAIAGVVVCLITSELHHAPLFRITLDPSDANGLKIASQIMVDKIVAIRRQRIRKTVGVLDDANLVRLNRSLMTFLGLP